MFELSVTPEILAYLLAGLVAIIFDWLPGLKEWFDKLTELKKKQVMAVVLFVIVAAIFGGICAGLFVTQYACDKVGLAGLVKVFLLCVGINQGIHSLSKPAK